MAFLFLPFSAAVLQQTSRKTFQNIFSLLFLDHTHVVVKSSTAAIGV